MVNVFAISLSENKHWNHKGTLSQFRNHTSSSVVLNSHIASTADTFFSKEGAIKTFWESKVIDEDDAEVSKCLTVFENASFETSTCFGFPDQILTHDYKVYITHAWNSSSLPILQIWCLSGQVFHTKCQTT